MVPHPSNSTMLGTNPLTHGPLGNIQGPPYSKLSHESGSEQYNFWFTTYGRAGLTMLGGALFPVVRPYPEEVLGSHDVHDCTQACIFVYCLKIHTENIFFFC
jgi:hypothetical protein